MYRLVYLALLALATFNGIRTDQEIEDDVSPCDCGPLRDQVRELQKNVTELWSYIYQLRNAMSVQLRHLRDHQVQTEVALEHMTHHSDHGSDSYHKHERQESHSHDHHAEESAHHDDHDHHQHEESSHQDDHDHHAEESTHHDDHDDHHHHHEESSHSGEDHHHHDDDQESSSHGHSHEESDHHHHHHDHSHEDTSKEKKEEVAEEVVVATVVNRHKPHGHVHDMRSISHVHSHHTHHDHGPSSNRTVFPRVGEYNQYRFAACNVESNRAISAELQQDVRGQVTFWQLKSGGPLGIHVRLQGFTMGDHHGQHHQTVQQEQQQIVDVIPNRLNVGHKHGFHVHAIGDMSNGCQSMGPHYNPEDVNHGGPNSEERHVGDLGNIECDDHGYTNIVFSDAIATLTGPTSILNRGLVVHADPDDYGMKPDDPESLKTGNAGTRIACCIIEEIERPSLKAYRYVKAAKQYQN